MTQGEARGAEKVDHGDQSPTQRVTGESCSSYWVDLVILAAVTFEAQFLFAIAGLPSLVSPTHLSRRVTIDRLSQNMHVLDLHYAGKHPVDALMNLQMQPPGWNLVLATFIHLPTAAIEPGISIFDVLCGLVVIVATYLAMRWLDIPRLVALLVTIVFVALDPGLVLLTRLPHNSMLSTAEATVMVAALAYPKAKNQWRWWVVGLLAAVMLLLTNSSFQWPWLVLLLIVCGRVLRGGHARREFFAAALVPVVLAGFWVVNDAARFGILATSDWSGMNLQRITWDSLPLHQRRVLVHQHKAPPIEAIEAWNPVANYTPRFAHLPRHGSPVRVMQGKDTGRLPGVNYNNDAFRKIANTYLAADLNFIGSRPMSYVHNVGAAVMLFTVAADQTWQVSGERSRVTGYADFYDRFVLWQPSQYGSRWLVEPYRMLSASKKHGPFVVGLTKSGTPSPAQVSWMIIFEWLISFVGGAWLLIRTRRHGSDRRLAIAAMLVTMGWLLVISTTTELGENMRFRFQGGTAPLILSTLVIVEVARGIRSRRAPHAEIS
jgi:hypothetical protein